jgi:hypothetical protein
MILANDVQAMKKACDEKGADWWRHVNEDRKTRIVTAQLMAEQITTRDLLQKVLGVDPDGNKSIILP